MGACCNVWVFNSNDIEYLFSPKNLIHKIIEIELSDSTAARKHRNDASIKYGNFFSRALFESGLLVKF